MEKRQSAEFKAQKLKTEDQYAKSQARMRVLENLQNTEVINTETNPYIYHNEDSKYQDGCIILQWKSKEDANKGI